MAFSLNGGKREWHFPREWADVQSVDIYKFNATYLALELAQACIPVADHKITLNLAAGEGNIIVPAGTVINNGTIYDNTPSGNAVFVSEDRTTRGNRKGKYGSVGYDVFGSENNLPEGVSVAYIGDELKELLENSTSETALLQPGSFFARIEAVRTSELHQIIELNLQEEQAVSLYFADYEAKNCQMLVEVIEPNTKQVLSARIINTLTDGVYLTYNLNGHVQVRLTRFFHDGYRGRNGYGPTGNPDYPICSGVFFDEKASTSEDLVTASANRLTCYIDPATRLLALDAEVHDATTARIQIHAATGALQYDQVFEAVNHRLRLTLPQNEWSAGHGIYIASLLTDKNCLNEKIIYSIVR